MAQCGTDRPLRPRRHADRLRRGHPGLVPPRDGDGARAPLRGRRRHGERRRATASAARWPPSTRTASTTWSPRTARTTWSSTATSASSPGIEPVLEHLRDERPQARHRHRQEPHDGRPHVRAAAARRFFEVVVNGDDVTEHKPDPAGAAARPRAARRERRPTAAYVGDSPFDLQAAKAAGMGVDRRHLGRHPRPRPARAGAAGRAHRPPGGAPWRRLGRSAPAERAASCSEQLDHHLYRVPRPRRPGDLGRRVRPPLRRARRARGRATRSCGLPTSPTQRVGAPPTDVSRRSTHLVADGLAREADDRRAARPSGPTTSASGSAATSPWRT